MMSKNQSYQDDVEQSCLDFVKNNMSDENFFGLSNKQHIELRNWINEAKPNFDNNFPDFVFNDGFIEHFAVTSSAEDRKGAKQKRESNVFKNKSETNFLSNFDSIKEGEMLFSDSYGRKFEEHTHFNIIKSVKKNWLKHIESYNKNISSPRKGIFLIEYTDINIQTAVSRNNEPAEIFDTYRISVDRQLLEWIYIFKEKIDYVIFINIVSSSIEIIRIDQIPELIKEILDVWYAPIVGMESHKYAGFKIREDNNQ